MSALVPTNMQLPAHLASRIGQPSAVASDMTAGMGGANFKRVSIRGGRFRIRDGSVEQVLPGDTLRAVIVGATPNTSKTFFKGSYDPDVKDKKPDCYSDDGVRPAADAEDPQSQLCATCEQNVWGSKMVGDKRMKACADQKKLAIISADDHSGEPELYQFTVTPAALTDFRTYGNMLQSKGYPPEYVITELYFDTKEAYPKIQFRAVGFVDEDMVPTINELVGSPLVNEIIGKTAATATAAKVVEAPAPKLAPVKYVEPEVELVVPDEIITPPKKGFGAAATKPLVATVVPTPAAKDPVPTANSSNLALDIQNILSSMSEEEDE